jgi:Tol biopolymer transport system component
VVRHPSRAALLGLSGVLLLLGGAGCRPATSGPASGAAPSVRSEAPWDLVYERTIGGNQDLYVSPAAGGVERRLTDDSATDGLPRWTRDGQGVLFTSNRSGNWQLWEVPASGGPARRVRTNAFREWQADWSPDGRRLAFLSNADGPECLWIMERDTGASRVLVRHGADTILGNPHWSPDGRRIVFSSNWRLPGHRSYIVDVASGEQTRVSPLTSGGCEPHFSPDGRKVVYVRRQHLTRERSALVEQDVAGGGERTLVDWPALNYDPVYSPDGTEIAFASQIAGDWAIYRQRLADGKSWRVTFGAGPARYPDYRPVAGR